MLSNLDLPFDLTEETKAINLEEAVNLKAGQEMNVYIPRYMPLIEKGEPEEYAAKVEINCFVTAEPIALTEGLQEKNYFTGLTQNNSSSVDIINKTDEDGKILRTFVEQDAEVRCIFKNGKLTKLLINTDINSDEMMTDFHFFHFNNEGGYGGTFTPSPYNHEKPDLNVNPNKDKAATIVQPSAKPKSKGTGTNINPNAGISKRPTSGSTK